MKIPHTLIFDCDGVILDSNPVKTEAFRQVGASYGDAAAAALVRFHVTHGGVSRYRKFEHFLSEILYRPATEAAVGELAARYGECVFQSLLDCPLAGGLAELRELTATSRWLIVSGGDQQELRKVFAQRGIAAWFDGGIYGSPANKDEILSRVFSGRGSSHPSLFIGDSRYDHEAAVRAGCDFVFVRRWTEFGGWQAYCEDNAIVCIDEVAELITLFREG
jgi:phosphoglycolate phosphatase-like HAD superfamily hydrolase